MIEEIAVIGLGKFGYYFAKTLMQLGYRVIGIDHDQTKTQMARDTLSQVYQTDATNITALEQAGLKSVSHVLVSVGDSIASSAMISMYLKEIGVPQVWAKAVSPDHKRLLEKIGVDQVIIPEHMAAVSLASIVAIPGFLQYATFDQDLCFQELVIDKWSGKSVRDLALLDNEKKEIKLVAVKKEGADKYDCWFDLDTPFLAGEKIVIIRKSNDSMNVIS